MKKISLLLTLFLVACGSNKPTKPTEVKRVAIQRITEFNTVKRGESADIWDRIKQGFQLPYAPNWQYSKGSYLINPKHIAFVSENSRPYIHYVVEQIEKRGLPTELAFLPMVESSYNPFAVSRSKAAGLWQFMPKTGDWLNLDRTYSYDARHDVIASTNAALDYLTYLYEKFNDWHLAIAAYNGGEGTVRRAMEANERAGYASDYWSLYQLSNETKNYVPKLLAYKEALLRSEDYGVQFASIPNSPYFKIIPFEENASFNELAYSTNTYEHELKALNAGFKGNYTQGGYNYLLVPKDSNTQYLLGTAR